MRPACALTTPRYELFGTLQEEDKAKALNDLLDEAKERAEAEKDHLADKSVGELDELEVNEYHGRSCLSSSPRLAPCRPRASASPPRRCNCLDAAAGRVC